MRPIVIALALLGNACVIVPAGGYGQKAGGDKVLICHKARQTMELPREAATAHIKHGDRHGPC